MDQKEMKSVLVSLPWNMNKGSVYCVFIYFVWSANSKERYYSVLTIIIFSGFGGIFFSSVILYAVQSDLY